MLLWKIYLWVMVILLVITYIKLGLKSVYNVVDLLISSIAWLGFFCFVYDIELFTPTFWKDVFFALIAWDIFYNIWILHKKVKVTKFELAASFIMLLPLYYGLYSYAFKFFG